MLNVIVPSKTVVWLLLITIPTVVDLMEVAIKAAIKVAIKAVTKVDIWLLEDSVKALTRVAVDMVAVDTVVVDMVAADMAVVTITVDEAVVPMAVAVLVVEAEVLDVAVEVLLLTWHKPTSVMLISLTTLEPKIMMTRGMLN